MISGDVWNGSVKLVRVVGLSTFLKSAANRVENNVNGNREMVQCPNFEMCKPAVEERTGTPPAVKIE